MSVVGVVVSYRLSKSVTCVQSAHRAWAGTLERECYKARKLSYPRA